MSVPSFPLVLVLGADTAVCQKNLFSKRGGGRREGGRGREREREREGGEEEQEKEEDR